MRRPGFWIVIGLLVSAIGLAVAIFGLRLGMHLHIWEPTFRTAQTIMGLGFTAVPLGLVLAAIAFVVYRKRGELQSGTGLVASWRVGMMDWATFRRRDIARGGLFRSLRNRLRLPEELPPEGMEIRIGRDAMIVGDGCYGLGYFASRGKLVDIARVEGPPAMLEFTTHITGRERSRLDVFRIPVPDAARAQAQAVLDHFNQTIDPARRDSIRSHYAPHFQAATGDAGEAEAARTEERRRNWGAWGFSLLVVGGLILAILLTKDFGPNADPDAVRMFTLGAGVLVAAGLATLVISVLSRR